MKAKGKGLVNPLIEKEEINSRLLNIIDRIKAQRPSIQDLLENEELEPPVETFPTEGQLYRAKKKNPLLYT